MDTASEGIFLLFAFFLLRVQSQNGSFCPSEQIHTVRGEVKMRRFTRQKKLTPSV